MITLAVHIQHSSYAESEQVFTPYLHTYIHTYLLNYLLTYALEQSFLRN